MSKEMIISVNGREKKIAILENGQVTEYYIERGNEENAGIVGNIYKGRVMRVLPGMQSAFVNIGLERDGFLYVSDFFDEEEEIERIVMEKSKESTPEEAEREATDHVQRSRLKREKQMEDVQDIAEPIAEKDSDDDLDEEDSDKKKSPDKRKKSRRGRKPQGRDEQKDKVEQEEQKEQEDREDKTEQEDRDRKKESSREKSSRSRNRRGRKEPIAEEENTEKENVEDDDREMISVVAEVGEIAPLFEDSSFERIIDDSDTGEMFKDAFMQEAIVDRVRAIEFDMESPETTEVGSLLDSVGGSQNNFERIADEDEEQEEEPKNTKSGRKTGRGRGGKSAKKMADEADDEENNADEDENVKSKGKRTSRAKKGTAKKKSSTKSKKAAADEDAKGETSEAEETESRSAKPKSDGRRKTSRAKKSAAGEKLEDGEASVTESGETAEMAVRRGGRGRRSSSNPSSKPDNDDDDNKNSKSSSGNNNRRGGGRRNSRQDSQPKITDLLTEGQEILVQIAKEPIAKKGARITSHIALPGRFLVYMPTIEHLGVSRKIESAKERSRLRGLIQKIKDEVDLPSGGYIVRTAGVGISEEDLAQDAKYLLRTWYDIRKEADKAKSPELVHQDLDIIQRLLRDHLSDEFTAIRVDSEDEYLRTVEFVNRIQPKMVKRVKLYTREKPILEAFGVQEEVDKALKPRVWLKSGGYLVINQTEALVAIDVNTGKFVGKGNARLEDTITKTNMEAVGEIARQIRLRDLGGIIVLDLIDMEDRRNRHKVLQELQDHLSGDKSPTKVLSFNDFGLIIMTRKRVKQSLERTMCAPCDYCEGAGWVKSPQTVCYEILEEARQLSKNTEDVRQTTLRVHPEVAEALRDSEKSVLDEIEEYLGNVDVTGDKSIHQEQFDFAFV